MSDGCDRRRGVHSTMRTYIALYSAREQGASVLVVRVALCVRGVVSGRWWSIAAADDRIRVTVCTRQRAKRPGSKVLSGNG